MNQNMDRRWRYEVTAERAFDAQGEAAVLLNLQANIVEINVFIPWSSIAALFAFLDADGPDCRAGESARCPAHWSRTTQGDAYLLIGDDQETWDIGVMCDSALMNSISNVIRQVLDGSNL